MPTVFPLKISRRAAYAFTLSLCAAGCWRVTEPPVQAPVPLVVLIEPGQGEKLLTCNDSASPEPVAARAEDKPSSKNRDITPPALGPEREREALLLPVASPTFRPAGPNVVRLACPPLAQVWGERCQLCHGRRGNGRGVAAENLRPGPPNFQAEAWQKGTSDDAIRKIVVLGSAGVGKSLMMPPEPDLAACPEVLQSLVRTVRAFQKNPSGLPKEAPL